MADLCQWEVVMQNTIVNIRSTLLQLHKLWEEIGFTEEARSIYCEQAFTHINDLLRDMVAETELKKERIISNVKELMEQIAILTNELGTDIVTTGYEHLPLKEVEQLLCTDLQKLQYCKEQRVTHFKELRAKERSLCKVLGSQPINMEEKLPSEEELNSFKLYLEKQEGEKNRLESIFKEMRRAIIKMMDDLGISPLSNFEHLIYKDSENFVFSSNNMTKLRELRDKLKEEVDTAREHTEDIKKELIALWKYLDEPEHICQAFLNSYIGYSAATINALTAELDKCKEKRKQNIAKYVAQVRSELVKLWDLCKFSEGQRKQFIHFNSHTYTEDLLTLHDLEVKRVQEFYETNKSIFELLEERSNLWTKMKELLQRANAPDRFYNRGGQLLMEEKERKTIQKKLPKIEEQLRNLITEHETMYGEAFTINGSASKKTPSILSTRRHTPLNSTKRRLLFTPSPNTSAKRRNVSITSNGSKIKKGGKVLKKTLQSGNKINKSIHRKENSISQSSAATDTTYSLFKEHLEDRQELRSSLLHDKILANAAKSKMKTPIRTPAKPLRKNLPIATTPIVTTPKLSHSQLHKSPRSPRIVPPTRLATVSTPLPIIF
ncbi:Protein regulator of cytokinesis 1 [Habropoda laboriosa]|uniref:Protein regulator of cytokinesis 1 n=1 Tax=Habropoda laboriosa TaxID=597456 RepID=A0A0L7R9I4_9HYME|nr:Protein regulator of cytokinesis 1 [Habropoda laboriosa]